MNDHDDVVNGESEAPAGSPLPATGHDGVVWFTYPWQRDIPLDVRSRLTHVRVAPSVKRLCTGAFRGCDSLVEVDMSSAVRLEVIEHNAFQSRFRRCTTLRRISKLPPSLKIIASYTFEGTKLESLDISDCCIEKIDGICKDCKKLKNASLPSTLKIIGHEAFSGCEQLRDFRLPSGLMEIENYAFNLCRSLRHVSMPHTVERIGFMAFCACSLESLEFPDGLEEIDGRAFKYCSSLKRIRIPPSVRELGDYDEGRVFSDCRRLEEVDLCEGLEAIPFAAFENCRLLRSMKTPMTQRRIEAEAFKNCTGLSHIELGHGLETIDDESFEGCRSINRIKLPSTIREIGEFSFSGCRQLVSIEVDLSEEMVRNENKRPPFEECASLRNIWVPSSTHALFEQQCHDLVEVFGSKENINVDLKERFKSLPIHEICYQHSYHETDWTARSLKECCESSPKIDTRDSLGMSPLHILACATKQDIVLYRLLMKAAPRSLVIADKWGCIPLFYAIWGNVPSEIVQLLITSQKTEFPDFVLNWKMMIQTLCRAGASPEIIMRLLTIQQKFYPEQEIGSSDISQELAISCLVRCNSCSTFDEDFWPAWESVLRTFSSLDQIYQSLLATQDALFGEDRVNTNWQLVCEEFVQPLKHWWYGETRPPPSEDGRSLATFRFLVKCRIGSRLDVLGIQQWRANVTDLVGKLPLFDAYNLFYDHIDAIHTKMVFYEHESSFLKDATSLLELALWKVKLNDESMTQGSQRKNICRAICGADMNIVISNVLPYLITK